MAAVSNAIELATNVFTNVYTVGTDLSATFSIIINNLDINNSSDVSIYIGGGTQIPKDTYIISTLVSPEATFEVTGVVVTSNEIVSIIATSDVTVRIQGYED